MIIFEIFILLFFTVCYVIGGQGHKWVRRYLGPAVFGSGLILLSFFDRKFGTPVLLGAIWYCPSLILFKYGVNDGNVFKKVLLRGLYGGSLGIAGLLVSISAGHIGWGIIQLFSAVWHSIYFGVRNPFSQYSNFGNLATIMEDVCIITGCVSIIPFLF